MLSIVIVIPQSCRLPRDDMECVNLTCCHLVVEVIQESLFKWPQCQIFLQDLFALLMSHICDPALS